MALFDFLKGKEKPEEKKQAELYAPSTGELVSIEDINDPVFSEKMMGDGFGIKPADGKVYAPGYGKVVSVFPTKHAIGIELDNGIQVLIHIGIDTVELKGEPFDTTIQEGAHVTPDTLISTVDLAGLEQAGKENTVIVILTNMESVEDFTITAEGSLSHGDTIGKVNAL